MTFDRGKWRRSFQEESGPLWRCPECNLGALRLLAKSLAKGETKDSHENRAHEAWEPVWIDGRFSCLLKCDNCRAEIAVSGSFDRTEVFTGSYEQEEYTNTYRPWYFSLSPSIIELPGNCPSAVCTEVERSFQLYWFDPDAAANRVRSAVEQLLTHLKIPKTTGPKGKWSRLSLHARVEKLREIGKGRYKPSADALMAIKWIGNAGSHATPLKVDDVDDGYELLEHVLAELFAQTGKKVARLARAINQRKKPRSARRRRRNS